MNPNELKMLIALQPNIKEAMGEHYDGDMLYSIDAEGLFAYCALCDVQKNYNTDKYIHIPLTIDPVNPERGLFGMLDKTKLWWLRTYLNGDVQLSNSDFQSWRAATPTEAILKALCEQWEVKI